MNIKELKQHARLYEQAKCMVELEDALDPQSIEEWHEDMGDCLWWFFPIQEAPYCGSPLDCNFPDYVTHFTKLIIPLSNQQYD